MPARRAASARPSEPRSADARPPRREQSRSGARIRALGGEREAREARHPRHRRRRDGGHVEARAGRRRVEGRGRRAARRGRARRHSRRSGARAPRARQPRSRRRHRRCVESRPQARRIDALRDQGEGPGRDVELAAAPRRRASGRRDLDLRGGPRGGLALRVARRHRERGRGTSGAEKPLVERAVAEAKIASLLEREATTKGEAETADHRAFGEEPCHVALHGDARPRIGRRLQALRDQP